MRAAAALLRAPRDMRSLPSGGMQPDAPADVAVPATNQVEDARRIALAVNRVEAFGVFQPKCLVRSRPLRKRLDAAGSAGAKVRVGVQLTDGRFRAHAWVEYAGEVVGDDPAAVARFVPMPDIRVAELE